MSIKKLDLKQKRRTLVQIRDSLHHDYVLDEVNYVFGAATSVSALDAAIAMVEQMIKELEK